MTQDSFLFGKKGFTLIELLVVISIIAILSSIILAALQNARISARNGRISEEVLQLRNALELLKGTSGTYSGFTTVTAYNGFLVSAVSDGPSTVLINDIASTTGGVLGNNVGSSGSGDLTASGNNKVGITIFTNPTFTQFSIYAILLPTLGVSGYYCADSSGKTTQATTGGANVSSGWWVNHTGQGSVATTGTCQ